MTDRYSLHEEKTRVSVTHSETMRVEHEGKKTENRTCPPALLLLRAPRVKDEK